MDSIHALLHIDEDTHIINRELSYTGSSSGLFRQPLRWSRGWLRSSFYLDNSIGSSSGFIKSPESCSVHKIEYMVKTEFSYDWEEFSDLSCCGAVLCSSGKTEFDVSIQLFLLDLNVLAPALHRSECEISWRFLGCIRERQGSIHFQI